MIWFSLYKNKTITFKTKQLNFYFFIILTLKLATIAAVKKIPMAIISANMTLIFLSYVVTFTNDMPQTKTTNNKHVSA